MNPALRQCVNRVLKTLLGFMVFGLGLHRALFKGRALVVAFHRVNRDGQNDAMNMQPELFARWCRFFAGHFRVVAAGEIVAGLETGGPFRGELAVTFDDGYRDFAQQAVPVMEPLGITATVFAVSDFVGSDHVPWWDEKAGERHAFMDWNELRAVAAKGFAVGSHGKTHSAMDELSQDEAREELTVSKAALETGLGREVALYAYPYGEPERMPAPMREIVRQTGYRACFGYGGFVEPGSSPFFIPRICVNDWFASPWHFAGHLVALSLRRRIA
jgi:peptidoglycan/xylan/chitin deacetylase (PgdA/CDA1 family)